MYVVSGGANMIVMASSFPKLKKSYSWKTFPLRPLPLARNQNKY